MDKSPTRIPLITAIIVLSFLGVVLLTFLVYCTVKACRKVLRRGSERKRILASPSSSSSSLSPRRAAMRSQAINTSGEPSRHGADDDDIDGSPAIFDVEAGRHTSSELRKTYSTPRTGSGGATTVATSGGATSNARHHYRRRKHSGSSLTKDRSLRSQSLEYCFFLLLFTEYFCFSQASFVQQKFDGRVARRLVALVELRIGVGVVQADAGVHERARWRNDERVDDDVEQRRDCTVW